MQVGWHLLTILDLVLLLPTDSEICFWYRSIEPVDNMYDDTLPTIQSLCHLEN